MKIDKKKQFIVDAHGLLDTNILYHIYILHTHNRFRILNP